MTDNAVTIIVAVLGSSVVLEAVKAIICAFKRASDSKEVYVKVSDLAPIKEGLMALMQDRLERVMTRYLDEGEMSTNQFKALQTMVKAYEDLGGDGFIHKLYEDCQELAIR